MKKGEEDLAQRMKSDQFHPVNSKSGSFSSAVLEQPCSR